MLLLLDTLDSTNNRSLQVELALLLWRYFKKHENWPNDSDQTIQDNLSQSHYSDASKSSWHINNNGSCTISAPEKDDIVLREATPSTSGAINIEF